MQPDLPRRLSGNASLRQPSPAPSHSIAPRRLRARICADGKEPGAATAARPGPPGGGHHGERGKRRALDEFRLRPWS